MRRLSPDQRGYTLAEIMVVVAISTVVMIVAYDLIDSAMRTSLFVESHNNLAQLAQRSVNFMQTEIYQSKLVYTGDATGTAYLTRITTPPSYPGAWPTCNGTSGCGGPASAIPTMPTMQVNSLLPMSNPSSVMGPDAGTGASRVTGNVLLLVRQLPPLLIPLTGGINFPADRYRFELYYLTRDTTRPFFTATYFVDLIQARSIDFADYFQLNPVMSGSSFTATQKTQIVNGLGSAGIHIAFDPSGQPVTSAFYSIAGSGAMTLQANQGIWLYQTKSLLPEFKGGSVSGKMVYTVGFRPSATTTFNIRDPIPKYAVYDNSIPAFPSGLEVKIVGTGSATKIMLRTVLLANYGVSKMDSQEGFVISAD